MKQWLIGLVVCVLAGTGYAQLPDPNVPVPDAYVFAQGLAGNAVGVARVGWKPADSRVSVFLQGVWIKDIDGDDVEGFGAHVGATYDVVKNQDIKFLEWNVPVTWYLGAIAGAVKPENANWQTSPGVLTGVKLLGNENKKSPYLVFEVWYLPGDSVSTAFANIESKGRFTVGAGFPF